MFTARYWPSSWTPSWVRWRIVRARQMYEILSVVFCPPAACSSASLTVNSRTSFEFAVTWQPLNSCKLRSKDRPAWHMYSIHSGLLSGIRKWAFCVFDCSCPEFPFVSSLYIYWVDKNTVRIHFGCKSSKIFGLCSWSKTNFGLVMCLYFLINHNNTHIIVSNKKHCLPAASAELQKEWICPETS